MTKHRWRDVDGRMQTAVALRREGLSNRKIASRLGVSEITIRRDLSRYEQQSVDRLLTATFTATSEAGMSQQMSHPEVAP